jgi:hypothetical protein
MVIMKNILQYLLFKFFKNIVQCVIISVSKHLNFAQFDRKILAHAVFSVQVKRVKSDFLDCSKIFNDMTDTFVLTVFAENHIGHTNPFSL